MMELDILYHNITQYITKYYYIVYCSMTFFATP